jgi:Flp pilus assembly protein TadD
MGLAYAQLAARGDQAAGARAMTLLHRVEGRGDTSKDQALHTELGLLEQADGKAAEAEKEFRLALVAEPDNVPAAEGLAGIEARRHDAVDAMRLWRLATEHDPTQGVAAMGLAVLECSEGERDAALKTLDRVLEFAPDDAAAQDLAEQVRSGRRSCGAGENAAQ